jgi:hypothetical protein
LRLELGTGPDSSDPGGVPVRPCTTPTCPVISPTPHGADHTIADRLNIHRPWLHARELRIPHRSLGEHLAFSSWAPCRPDTLLRQLEQNSGPELIAVVISLTVSYGNGNFVLLSTPEFSMLDGAAREELVKGIARQRNAHPIAITGRQCVWHI